ncbi:hypothetical protein ACFY7A_03925 [Streptomyces longwoodensis]|uniref:hypothetical protein n=1 Tax=Streptomyces longwoodensis TaxID=68231 RepID=UPI0036C35ADE
MGSSTFLIGGGWDAGAVATVYGPFVRAAAARAAGRAPRVGCVVLDEGDGPAQFARYEPVLRAAGDCEPVPVLVPLGGRFAPAAVLDGVDGLLVCGGLTPAYQEAFAADAAATASLLAERGIPYAGFSAGAALAARDAVVGGWRADGVAVCPEDAGEDLDEVAVRPGLGLVPFAVDVHAAQWGTLPRLAAAVAAGRVERGVALDEDTAVEVAAGAGQDGGVVVRVAGLGRAHTVRRAPDGAGVLVRSYGAGASFTVSG